jgi:hypothetical protein
MNPQQIIDSLSEAEKAYFIACTDIFHDSSYSVIGRPSLSNQLQNTVVINLERTISLNDFPTIPAGSNWDVNIVSYPFITTNNLITTVDNGYSVQLPAVPSHALTGGVTMYANVTGGPTLIPNFPPVSLNANQFFYPEFTGTSTDDIPRPFYEILSIGMEVINSTPELYRGGSVVRYRVPTQGRRSELLVGDPVTQTSQARTSFFCYPMPPTTEAFATQYPDSVIDQAAAGSYQMHTLQDQVSDYYMAGNSRVFLANPVPTDPLLFFNTYTSASAFENDPLYTTDPPLVRGDFDIIGSYFTGLSPQTTLKIRSRSIVSLVPSSSNAQLVSLAKVSPGPNPQLDYLIALIQASFTPGIESSMNASGDWWKIVLKSAGKLAPMIGQTLGGDTGETIGKGVQAGIGLIVGKKKNKTAKQQPQSKPKPSPKAKAKKTA